MIGYMQIAAIIIEYIVEVVLKEKMLVAPFSVSLGVIQNLMTFGAPNFLLFLDGFFVSVGIQMFQRPYLTPIQDFLFTYIEEKVPRVLESIQNWFKN